MAMFCTSGFITGPHTGDRLVSLSNGQLWTPKVVVAKVRDFAISVPIAERAAYVKIDSMAGNLCHKVGIANSPFTFTDAIRTVSAGGFTINEADGIMTDTNDAGWFALGGDSVVTGSYTGDGSDPQTIAVAGLTANPPQAAIISSEIGDFVTSVPPVSQNAFNHPGWTQYGSILSVSTSGFDASGLLNVSGRDYYYAVVNDGPIGRFAWTGDGADDHDVTGVLGYAPEVFFGARRTSSGTATSLVGGFHVKGMDDAGFDSPGATTAWTPETYSGSESFAVPRGSVLHADHVTVEAGPGDGWPLNQDTLLYRGWVIGQSLQQAAGNIILPNF